MNITFNLFMHLEVIWLFFFLCIVYFVAVSYMFKAYYDKLFFFSREKNIQKANSFFSKFTFDYFSINLFCLRYLIMLVLIFFFFI